MKTLIPFLRPLAFAGAAAFLLAAPAVHAQILNVPTNLSIVFDPDHPGG